MARIQIANGPSGRMIVSFPYDLLPVEKVKSIDGGRWHPAGKHRSFPNKNGILEKILRIFEGPRVCSFCGKGKMDLHPGERRKLFEKVNELLVKKKESE